MTQPARIAKGMWWDRAWSLVSGCSYVSEGCAHCWAANEAHIRAGQSNEKIRARYGGLTDEDGRWNGTIRMNRDVLELPLRTRKPTTWAIWNDLFHEDVPFDFIMQAFSIMARCPWHTFVLLTKRPDVMKEFFSQLGSPADPLSDAIYDLTGSDELSCDVFNMVSGQITGKGGWPLPNVINMVTVENQEEADTRIPLLLQCPSAYRGISVEPMLGWVDIRKWLPEKCAITGFPAGHPNACGDCDPCIDPRGIRSGWRHCINQVICGGESGPGARPMHPIWVRKLRDDCQYAGVQFFFKQWGEWSPEN
jgi:protein gp37